MQLLNEGQKDLQGIVMLFGIFVITIIVIVAGYQTLQKQPI